MYDKNSKNPKDNIDEIKVKKSKYERVLRMSNDEIIARAIQDVLQRESENENFKNNIKK